MTLEKCFFCVYSSQNDVVVTACEHHVANWDPTIEDQEARAVLPYPTPEGVTVARLPYVAPEVRDVTDPAEAQRLRDEIEGVGFNPAEDRGHSPAGKPALPTLPVVDVPEVESVIEGGAAIVPDVDDEAPPTPRDREKEKDSSQ